MNLYKRLNNHYSVADDKLTIIFSQIFILTSAFNSSNFLDVGLVQDYLKQLDKILLVEINRETGNYVQMIENMNVECQIQGDDLIENASTL